MAASQPTAILRGAPGQVSVMVEELGGHAAIVVRSETERDWLTAAAGEAVAAAANHALSARMPFVGLLSASGADVAEGVSALQGWGKAARALQACSGQVPIVLVAIGPVLAGPSLLLGMADVVIMTKDALAYVSGPEAVAAMTARQIDASSLGGAPVHSRLTGLAAMVAADEEAGMEMASDILSFLPSNSDEAPLAGPCADPLPRSTPQLANLIPETSAGSYDVEEVIGEIADDGDYIQLRELWAPQLVTALARIGGQPVGILANQPKVLAGTLDIAASQKGARFVSFCDSFNLPLVTLVDTPGFLPGKDLEWRGMIRHGAQLAFAYAEATIPRICVVLRKAYGGAYIVMDSKAMGADLNLAWPTAELAVMGAQGAAQILHRRSSPEERAAAEENYRRELLTPWIAAERGLVDAVIDPADTRTVLSSALATLVNKQEKLRRRKHSNSPL